MRKFLKVYEVKLTTLSPVFIGNGKEISKKEYMLLANEGKAVVMDQARLYYAITRMGKAIPFEKYLLDANAKNLYGWFQENSVDYHNLKDAIKYEVDYGDRFFTQKGKIQIMEFVKDSYNMPYIPGSSLKGALRTIILAGKINSNANFKENSKNNISSGLSKVTNRRNTLKREIRAVEDVALRTLNRGSNQENPRNRVKPNDAVNDILQGLIVSDSKPLSAEDLVLCQRIEKHTDGQEKSLNVLRECIKPGTEISFTISIDTSVCNISIDDIMSAISCFNENYYENFSSAFGVDRPLNNDFLLGGGVGFVSKTVVYSIFPGTEGLKKTVEIFNKTGVPFKHKHHDDTRKGVSPHVLKCTRYKGKLYEMGKCRFEMKEVTV